MTNSPNEVITMRFVSRNLFLALALGAFAFTATSGWASLTPAAPVQSTPGMQSTHSKMHTRSKSRTESITGTIVKSGSTYVLRASTGQEYQLANASQAKSDVGKSVTVTGKVNASSHMIDVQSIQPQ